MDGNCQTSPQAGFLEDTKYVSGLSTILVATIQEAKDRISQIEYIFCSQIYPNFQSKSKSMQKLFYEVREAAEASWKEKERDLLLQIAKVQSEKQQCLDEIHSLKLERENYANLGSYTKASIRDLQDELSRKTKEVEEGREAQAYLGRIIDSKTSLILDKEKSLKELEEGNGQLLKRERSLEVEVDRLKCQLGTKSKEMDGGMELQSKLLEMVKSKTSLVMELEKRLKNSEEKAKLLFERLESANKKVEELQQESKGKTEELEKGEELRDDLQKRVESQATEIMERNLLLDKCDNVKRLLEKKLEKLDSDVHSLLKEIKTKNDEAEQGRKQQEQLLQQIDLYNLERIKTGQEFEMLEKEKQHLVAKLKGLEEKVLQLQLNLQERSTESSEGMELHGKLLQEIEAKDSQLLVERKKISNLHTLYKKLKSQYNFLCAKYGLTTENMLTRNKTEDEMDGMGHNQGPMIVDAKAVPNDSDLHGHKEKGKDNRGLLDDQTVGAIQKSNSPSPSSRSFIQPKYMEAVRSCPPAGAKRRGSFWRDTRSHQSRFGPDLHDDFLDTPLEKIKADNSKGATKDEVTDLPDGAPQDMDFDESGDETQDLHVVLGPQKKQMLHPGPGTSNYKYVEPVRKKAERENLKGIECKQCKKFYDAVLPNEGQEQSVQQNFRCEHHDGVSRHRYRYAPPSTPEGFWNIGFESEM